MSPAGFLLLAAGISVVGSIILWLQHRRPTGIDATIDGFRRELRALSPENSPDALVREQSRLRAEGRAAADARVDEEDERWAPALGRTTDAPTGWVVGDPSAVPIVEAEQDDEDGGYLSGLYQHDEDAD